MNRSVWIGYEPRELDGYVVAVSSAVSNMSERICFHGIILKDLEEEGLYRRAWHRSGGQMYDKISDAPMSTEFSISRFLTPHLARKHGQTKGWALYMDCDVLVRADLVELFKSAELSGAALACVKHMHDPTEVVKMDAQKQVRYPRKNWSSVMLFNLEHPANEELTLSAINQLPGRDLHRFCWLKDEDIFGLGPEWNYLAGVTELAEGKEPNIVHFTKALPQTQGYLQRNNRPTETGVEYAAEWHDYLLEWVRG